MERGVTKSLSLSKRFAGFTSLQVGFNSFGCISPMDLFLRIFLHRCTYLFNLNDIYFNIYVYIYIEGEGAISRQAPVNSMGENLIEIHG